jgi:hypothetical protein
MFDTRSPKVFVHVFLFQGQWPFFHWNILANWRPNCEVSYLRFGASEFLNRTRKLGGARMESHGTDINDARLKMYNHFFYRTAVILQITIHPLNEPSIPNPWDFSCTHFVSYMQDWRRILPPQATTGCPGQLGRKREHRTGAGAPRPTEWLLVCCRANWERTHVCTNFPEM